MAKKQALPAMLPKFKMRPTSELVPDPKNPRIPIQGEDRKSLIRSIERFGFIDPIITSGNWIVDGHQRLDVWTHEFGQTQVPTVDIGDLTEAERLALNVATDRIRTQFDEPKLYAVLSRLEEQSIELAQSTGFSAQELSALEAAMNKTTQAAVAQPIEGHESTAATQAPTDTQQRVDVYFVVDAAERDLIMARLRAVRKEHNLDNMADALCHEIGID